MSSAASPFHTTPATADGILAPSASSPPSSPFGFPAPSSRLAGAWQVRVLGGFEARNGDVVLRHFVSHAIGALLARLALFPQRIHAREELVELLWPGVEIDTGRNRLRHALSTLKRLLEPPGGAAGSVLVADRHGIQLAPGAMQCDAALFERFVRTGRLDEARACYRGEVLPGFYDDWVQDERRRLSTLREQIGEGGVALPDRADAGPDDAARPDAAHVDTQPSFAPAAAIPAHRAPLLPGYLTSYFGRHAERLELLAWLSAHRLVTLSGTGGCGKTRLAVETARETVRTIGGFDFVAFVALADCSTGPEAAAQLRTALQLPAAAADPVEQAIAMLALRRPLLVLDNFEQLVASGGTELVATLLERVPALHLLVTSRRVLGVAGEREFALAPLPQPDAQAPLADVAANPSVALFIDRARQVRPDFQVTARNCESLVALCSALEGLPLAIELAASRSRAFSPRDMHAALAERFTLLARTGARHGARAGQTALRHDSLRGAIDWSWQLLSVQQQRFLLALSVFRGGWTAGAAQVVCDEPAAHALLESLAADSLLRSDVDAGGAMRFSMLDMIRAFLRERLDPSTAAALRRQHRAHGLATALALQAGGGLALDAVELPNIHEALRSAVDDGEPELGLMLGLALRQHWERNGIAPEALAWLLRALDASTPGEGPWVQACCLVALLTLAAGEGSAARALAARALAAAGEAPLPRAAALCATARIAIERHDPTPLLAPMLREAIALAEAAGADELVAQAMSQLGMLALVEARDAVSADELFAAAHARLMSIGLAREASHLLYERTICRWRMGQVVDALAEAQAFERACVLHGDQLRQIKAINLQGVLLSTLKRWVDALQAYRRCAELAWRTHNHYWLGFALWNLCRNLARSGAPEQAALLMSFSEKYWCARVGQLDAKDLLNARQVRAVVRHQIGETRTATLWAEGASLSLAEAMRLARVAGAGGV